MEWRQLHVKRLLRGCERKRTSRAKIQGTKGSTYSNDDASLGLLSNMPGRFENHCEGCPYSQSPTGSNLPLSKESNGGSILLVFQAPGLDEWSHRIPICSPNGRSTAARVRNSLARLKKSRSDFDITNAVQCFPGKTASGRDRKPSEIARKKCSEWLRSDINQKTYSKIIVFGNVARKSIDELLSSQAVPIIYLKHPSGGLSNAALDNALANNPSRRANALDNG